MAPAVIMAMCADTEGRRASVLRALQTLEITAKTMEMMDYRPPGYRDGLTGIFCKNLLLRDRKSRLFLIIFPEHLDLDLKHVKQEMCSHNEALFCQDQLSFASVANMADTLGCFPGAVSPLGVHLDIQNKVKVILDQSLLQTDQLLNFHPLDPDLTTLLSGAELLQYLDHYVHSPFILDLNANVH